MRDIIRNLENFFASWPESTSDKIPQSKLEEHLPEFFDALRQTGVGLGKKPVKRLSYIGDGERLFKWFEMMREPILIAKRAGAFCDPWQVAGLKHDEVRNSRVLAWLLDPAGSHGKGALFLDALIRELKLNHPNLINNAPQGKWFVRTEICPDGDNDNRVDILLSCASHYVVIEVKIYAGEGKKQMSRYADVASTCAGTRDWLVVFLTPHGRPPVTAGAWSTHIVPLSWRRIATIFSIELRVEKRSINNPLSTEGQLTNLLANRFLAHIRDF